MLKPGIGRMITRLRIVARDARVCTGLIKLDHMGTEPVEWH